MFLLWALLLFLNTVRTEDRLEVSDVSNSSALLRTWRGSYSTVLLFERSSDKEFRKASSTPESVDETTYLLMSLNSATTYRAALVDNNRQLAKVEFNTLANPPRDVKCLRLNHTDASLAWKAPIGPPAEIFMISVPAIGKFGTRHFPGRNLAIPNYQKLSSIFVPEIHVKHPFTPYLNVSAKINGIWSESVSSHDCPVLYQSSVSVTSVETDHVSFSLHSWVIPTVAVVEYERIGRPETRVEVLFNATRRQSTGRPNWLDNDCTSEDDTVGELLRQFYICKLTPGTTYMFTVSKMTTAGERDAVATFAQTTLPERVLFTSQDACTRNHSPTIISWHSPSRADQFSVTLFDSIAPSPHYITTDPYLELEAHRPMRIVVRAQVNESFSQPAYVEVRDCPNNILVSDNAGRATPEVTEATTPNNTHIIALAVASSAFAILLVSCFIVYLCNKYFDYFSRMLFLGFKKRHPISAKSDGENNNSVKEKKNLL
jgi:hypothetical protein